MPLEARTGILKQSELQDQPWLKGGDINSNSWHEEMWSYISEGMGSEKGKELQPLFFQLNWNNSSMFLPTMQAFLSKQKYEYKDTKILYVLRPSLVSNSSQPHVL